MKARSDWLVKLRLSYAIYLRATREKMAFRFASVASEEITEINDEAVPENTKKATKLCLAVFKSNGLSLTRSLSIKTNEKGFVFKCKLSLRNLTCSLENQSGMIFLQNNFGGVYYLIVLVYTKTTIYLSVGG